MKVRRAQQIGKNYYNLGYFFHPKQAIKIVRFAYLIDFDKIKN